MTNIPPRINAGSPAKADEKSAREMFRMPKRRQRGYFTRRYWFFDICYSEELIGRKFFPISNNE
jgi:hypothetical protein